MTTDVSRKNEHVHSFPNVARRGARCQTSRRTSSDASEDVIRRVGGCLRSRRQMLSKTRHRRRHRTRRKTSSDASEDTLEDVDDNVDDHVDDNVHVDVNACEPALIEQPTVSAYLLGQ